ncbi:hypothetical protein GCM10009865_20120 [Aeromicrobium ponti]
MHPQISYDEVLIQGSLDNVLREEREVRDPTGEAEEARNPPRGFAECP